MQIDRQMGAIRRGPETEAQRGGESGRQVWMAPRPCPQKLGRLHHPVLPHLTGEGRQHPSSEMGGGLPSHAQGPSQLTPF